MDRLLEASARLDVRMQNVEKCVETMSGVLTRLTALEIKMDSFGFRLIRWGDFVFKVAATVIAAYLIFRFRIPPIP